MVLKNRDVSWAQRINRSLMKSLDAEVILVGTPNADSRQQSMIESFDIAARSYGDLTSSNFAGCVVNRVADLTPPGLTGQSWADRDRSSDWHDVPD